MRAHEIQVCQDQTYEQLPEVAMNPSAYAQSMSQAADAAHQTSAGTDKEPMTGHNKLL
jgi:hypothetical protein